MMCVCVKVQLVQVTMSVESEVLVRTCASRLLDSQLHNICSGLEKMGGNLWPVHQNNQPVVDGDNHVSRSDAALPGGAVLHNIIHDQMETVVFAVSVSQTHTPLLL